MRFAVLFLAAVFLFARSAAAGGPTEAGYNGEMIRWPLISGPDLTLTLDQGNLGALSNSEADALVAGSLAVWNASSTAAELATTSTELPVDVTPANYTSYIFPNGPPPANPIIYDADGSILEAMFGAGASNWVLGYTRVRYNNYVPPTYMDGYIILNGRALDGVSSGSANIEFTPEEFRGVVVHELGHLLGLDHAQINAADQSNNDQPSMFPIFYGGEAMSSLAPDDLAWIGHLYSDGSPTTSATAISGRVIQRIGAMDAGFQGVNVIARRIGGGRIEAVSCVSGYRFRNGTTSMTLRGEFILPGLAPGDYSVEIEEILDHLPVGPLDPPANLPIPAGPEFYDGSGESAYDPPLRSVPVTVQTGQIVSGVDIILNTEVARLQTDRWMLYQ